MLTRFDFYVIRLLLKNIFIVQLFVTAVALMVSAFQSLDRFEGYTVTIKQLFINEMIALPIKINNTLGISITIASILTVALLMRSKEMLAYLSIGGRIARILVPFVLAAAVASAGMIGFECKIYPYLKASQNKYQAYIRNTVYSDNARLFNLWLIDNSSHLINVERVDPFNKTITNYREYNIDESFQLSTVRTIEKATNIDGKWILTNVSTTDLSSIPPSVTMETDISIESEMFDSLTSMYSRRRKELNAAEMSQMINIMKEHGQNAVSYQMVLYAIYANGTSTIIMVLLVVPIGMNFSRRYSPLKSSVISFTLVLAFWGILSVANSLGYSEALSPMVANFSPHVIFILIGMALLIWRERVR